MYISYIQEFRFLPDEFGICSPHLVFGYFVQVMYHIDVKSLGIRLVYHTSFCAVQMG